MTQWEPPRTVEHRGRALGFAVQLVDAFTGEQPAEDVDVGLADASAEPVRNPSGFAVFLALDRARVVLTVDGGDAYRDERREVLLEEGAQSDTDLETWDASDPRQPVVVELTPTPAYAFPDSTTTIRGHVRDAAGQPVPGATVSLGGFDPVVRTTDTGEYALWVPATSEDVRRREGRSVVVVDEGGDAGRAVADGGQGTDPTLVVTHPDFPRTTEAIEVAAGTRTVHYVTLG